MTKHNTSSLPQEIANLFHILGQPARVKIIIAIGTGEACVCHLEAALGMRQAYISQQLMALRQDGIVETRKEQRNVYYRLVNPEILLLIEQAARLAGHPEAIENFSGSTSILRNCPCPHCAEVRGRASFIPTSALDQSPLLTS